MGAKSNYSNKLYEDYEKVCIRLDTLMEELSNIRKDHKNEIKQLKIEYKKETGNLNKTIKQMAETINSLKSLIEKKDQEILRLKSKNDRDSSNSSKPSSTNGYKKVIVNRREKSDKNQGGQKGHKAHSLTNKLTKFIESGDIEEEIIEINKTEKNKNKRYIEKVVIDIKITKTLKRYRYYPDELGRYNIPEYHNQKVKYGNTIKAISVDLMNHLYNSTDGVTRFINDITNGGMTISKGTLALWNEEMSNCLESEITKIEESLRNSYYLNHDESQIKIDGEGHNILCACNKKYTRLWVHKHKSQEALKEIGFLPLYQGIIVKDGTNLYNPFGIRRSQCISHILRYLVPYYKEIKHKAPKKMKEFLSKYNELRNQKIKQGYSSFSQDEYKSMIREYEIIIDEWEKELREDTNNYLFDDELCLWTRMKYDNTGTNKINKGDKNEILYFLKDFKVPSTNNDAETAQRPTKIKQKIGKFRSLNGAEFYSKIRSCISTYKKNQVNVLQALILALNHNPIII